MSTLNVSNITDGTTTVGTSYVVNGSAKAWVFVIGTGTAAIANSLNASSITDNGTGDYTVSWTNAFDAWNNQACVSDGSFTQSIGGPYTVSSYYNESFHDTSRRVRTYVTSTQYDCEGISIAIHGDLA